MKNKIKFVWKWFKIIFIRTPLWILLGFFVLWGALALMGITEPDSYEYILENEEEYGLFTFDNISDTLYTSGDSITDMVLNFYSGRSPLSRDVMLSLVQRDSVVELRERSRREYVRNQRELDSVIVLLENRRVEDFDSLLISNGTDVEDIFPKAPEHTDKNVLYHAIWKLYFYSGSPRIRLVANKDKIFVMRFGVDAYYGPLTNTLYISSPYIKDDSGRYSWSSYDLFAESAHALQFEIAPCRSISQGTYSIVRSLAQYSRDECVIWIKNLWYTLSDQRVRKKTNVYELNDYYEREYSRKGSLEYEAHELIAKYFRAEYQIITESPIMDIGY